MDFNNLIYYSINSYLSYQINENFYNGAHYVWCSPIFDCESLDKYDIRRNIPPSSNPYKIYTALKEDVDRNDLHSAKIDSNKKGIKAGASIMLEKGVINEYEFGVITKMVDSSSTRDFRPLVYLIPKGFIENRIETVDVSEKANPLSVEYRVLDLRNEEFEIIEF